MAQPVRDLMTPNPTVLSAGTSITEAARTMRDQGIGALIVDTASGPAIVTDRDIVIRGVAGGERSVMGPIESVCSRDVVSVSPDSEVDDAVAVMRERGLRRLVVMEHGEPVGIVSIGDLAVDRDPHSALGGISRAVPNR